MNVQESSRAERKNLVFDGWKSANAPTQWEALTWSAIPTSTADGFANRASCLARDAYRADTHYRDLEGKASIRLAGPNAILDTTTCYHYSSLTPAPGLCRGFSELNSDVELVKLLHISARTFPVTIANTQGVSLSSPSISATTTNRPDLLRLRDKMLHGHLTPNMGFLLVIENREHFQPLKGQASRLVLLE